MKADSQLQRDNIEAYSREDREVHLTNKNQPTDASLSLAALKALCRDSDVPLHRFSVDVRDGIVTLCGTADGYYQRGAAARAVRFVAGVREVRNQIAVAPPVTAKDVKRRITDALHRGVSEEVSRIQVDVDVADGAITLTGTVRSACERKDAVSAAASALGVRVVNDELQVVDA